MDGEIYNRAAMRIAQLQAELQRLEAFVCTYRELDDEFGAAAEAPSPPTR